MGQLDGKRALVTGAAGGIGRALAEVFIERGAEVMLADIDAAGAAVVAKELGPAADSVECDVADASEVQSAVEATVGRFGGLDVMVNNAGIEPHGLLVEISEEDFRRSLDVNLVGVWHGIKYAAPEIQAAGGGTILNISSILGFTAAPLMGAYAATKGAVLQLTRTAALELRPAGIRVNAICPGFILTPMVDRLRDTVADLIGTSLDEMVAARQGRMGEPRDVATVAAHLVSDDALLVSGAAYVVDNAASVSLL